MPTGRNIFTGRNINANNSSPSAVVPIDAGDKLSVGVQVHAGSAGPAGEVSFFMQWSFDGETWTDGSDPSDLVAKFTGPGFIIKRLEIKAPYWRLGSSVTGVGASFSATSNALVW